MEKYYASLASRISEETVDTAGTETHQPVYNEDLVRNIDAVHVELGDNNVVSNNSVAFASVSREAIFDSGGRTSGRGRGRGRVGQILNVLDAAILVDVAGMVVVILVLEMVYHPFQICYKLKMGLGVEFWF